MELTRTRPFCEYGIGAKGAPRRLGLAPVGQRRERDLEGPRGEVFVTPITPFGCHFRQSANSQWFSMARIAAMNTDVLYFQRMSKFPS